MQEPSVTRNLGSAVSTLLSLAFLATYFFSMMRLG